jgi:hypothetical protein
MALFSTHDKKHYRGYGLKPQEMTPKPGLCHPCEPIHKETSPELVATEPEQASSEDRGSESLLTQLFMNLGAPKWTLFDAL